ncbi:MAG TPA: hypothetical protein VHM90_18525, partial [Phycisphaerae bacterium]|nr:hypothetical protein [Phycisphaerae bacterium]
MGWFSKKRMVGGMAFGPPGWMPERIEETFDAASSGVEGAFARGSTGDPAPLARGSTGDPEGISKASVSVPAASAEDSQGSRGDTAGLARGSGGHAAAMTGASGGDAAATAGSSREAEAGVARGPTPVAAGSGRAADGTRSVPATVVLTDRHSLLETLARMKLARASAMIPGLAEQVESLAGKGVRAMVLVLLPTQPEYVLGPALSKLAMEEMTAGMEALKKALRPGGVYIVMDRHELWLRNLWKGPAAALGARRVGL